MAQDAIPLESWEKLYTTAMKVKELGPWQWMDEADIFGVQDTETDELDFVSVMGALGEHYAVGVYLGMKALYSFWELQYGGEEVDPQGVLEIPQVQLSFEDRRELEREDLEIIKKLGLKFRGRNAWPRFRSIRPGHFPWFLNPGEDRILLTALEQVLDVAPRFQADQSLLHFESNVEYLVRAPRKEGIEIVWEDRIVQVQPPEPVPIEIPIDRQVLDSLKQVPLSKDEVQVDLFMAPMPVHEKGSTPFFPYVILMVLSPGGAIIGTDMLKPEPTLEAMWSLVPMNVARTLDALKLLPETIKVRSGLLGSLLDPVAREVGIKVKVARKLSQLDSAKDYLFESFFHAK